MPLRRFSAPAKSGTKCASLAVYARRCSSRPPWPSTRVVCIVKCVTLANSAPRATDSAAVLAVSAWTPALISATQKAL